jgi:hypothetical protein
MPRVRERSTSTSTWESNIVVLYIFKIGSLSQHREARKVASHGGLAQLAERVLSMHEVSGSIPEFSILLPFA